MRIAEFIDHDAVIDDQIDRHQRIDLGRIAAQFGDGIAHGRQIDHAGHAGEILHQHPRRAIIDLMIGRARPLPIDDGLHIGHLDGAAVFKAQQVFQQHLHRIRQPRHIAELRRGGFKAVIGVILAADIEGAAGVQAVVADGGHGAVSCV